MQIIRYTRDDLEQYCPVTGRPLLDAGEPHAPSVRGVWVDELMEEPTIVSPELQAAWDAFVAAAEDSEDGDVDGEQFLEEFVRDGWVVFELTNTESDVPSRGWVVVDLEMEIG